MINETDDDKSDATGLFCAKYINYREILIVCVRCAAPCLIIIIFYSLFFILRLDICGQTRNSTIASLSLKTTSIKSKIKYTYKKNRECNWNLYGATILLGEIFLVSSGMESRNRIRILLLYYAKDEPDGCLYVSVSGLVAYYRWSLWTGFTSVGYRNINGSLYSSRVVLENVVNTILL